METGEIKDENVSVGEDAPKEEEEIEHELDESLPIFNFAFCTSDELIEFITGLLRFN